jgi:hypothetical protein
MFSSVNSVTQSETPVISLAEDQSARRNTVQEFAKSVFWTPLFFLTKWLTGNCCPITDYDLQNSSYRECAEGFFLTRAEVA